MMGTMATVEDEEIDDVSLLGATKRGKKKKYIPTRAEIWHEADRLWMMAELLEREKEREERRAARLALTGSELEPVPPPGSPPGGAVNDGGLTPFYRHVSRQKPLTPEFYPEKPSFSQTGVLYPPLGTRTGPPIPGGHGTRMVTPRATSRMTMSRATSRGKTPREAPKPSCTVARYVVDFGAVVKGAALSKRFTVQNLGDGDMLFAFDKKDLERRGFRVYPEYMPKLSGQPYCQTTEVTLTLNTAMEHVEEGVIDFTVPLSVTGGPQALVTIKAVVPGSRPRRQHGDA
jgi:hypothetical protein